MKKKSVFGLLSLFCTTAIFVVIFASVKKTYICIQDELFADLDSNNLIVYDNSFSVISQTDFQKLTETFLGKTSKIAAFIAIEKTLIFSLYVKLRAKNIIKSIQKTGFPLLTTICKDINLPDFISCRLFWIFNLRQLKILKKEVVPLQ